MDIWLSRINRRTTVVLVILMSHPMDSGLRKDSKTGKLIPEQRRTKSSGTRIRRDADKKAVALEAELKAGRHASDAGIGWDEFVDRHFAAAGFEIWPQPSE